MYRIEYDDGKPLHSNEKFRPKECVPKDRARGFYVIHPDGTEEKVPIGYLRLSEVKHLETMLNAAWLMGRSI